MTEPSVSVILPTYNRAAFLPRAIRSVLDQGYSDLELIVVDDCSMDNTQAVLSQFADTRLRVMRQPANGGPSMARNAGIRESRGRYIAFQDSDSVWLPGKLTKQMACLKDPARQGEDIAACYSRFAVVCGSRRVIQPGDPGERLSGHIYRRLLQSNTMDTPAMVIRRDILDRLGCFDESMEHLEDWDLALRIGLRYQIVFLDEVTILSQITPGSVNVRLAPESKVTILRKNYQAYRESPEAMAPLTWSIGMDYAMRGDRRSAVRYMQLSADLASTGGKKFLLKAVNAGLNPYPMLHCARRLWRAYRVGIAAFSRDFMSFPAQQIR